MKKKKTKKQKYPALKQATNEFKRRFILKSLEKNYGSISLTAKMLGLSRYGLVLNIEELKIGKKVKNLVSQIKRKKHRGPVAEHVKKHKVNRLKEEVDDFQKEFISSALEHTRGFKLKAARLIHIHRNTMSNKVKYFGLEENVEKFRRDRQLHKINR